MLEGLLVHGKDADKGCEDHDACGHTGVDQRHIAAVAHDLK